MRGMKGMCAGICVLLVLAFVSCGMPQEGQSVPADTAVTPETAEQTKAPVTEEDFRNALSTASGDEKIALYRDFCANYIMNEEEYRDYAKLLADAGDSLGAREVLFMLYKSDPSEEHGKLLSELPVMLDGENAAEAEETLEGLAEALRKLGTGDFSEEEVLSILSSDAWKKTFYIDNGTFTSYTEVSGEITASVVSDSLATRVLFSTSEEGFLVDATPSSLKAGRKGNADETYAYRSIGADGVDIVSVTGYARDGHYVNQLDLTVDGVHYQGSFDDAGKTKEAQPDGVNGTVYAYSDDGDKYLYAENVSPADFVATPDALGFEAF